VYSQERENEVAVNRSSGWTRTRRRRTSAKHGVSFLTAAAIFANETVETIGDRDDYHEVRFIALSRADTGDLLDSLRLGEPRRDPDHQRAEGEQT
jgi:hypothetical protein